MSKNHTEHFATKSKVHTFYIGFDLNNDGALFQRKSKFYDELFLDITSFAFGSDNAMSRIETPQDILKVQREAFRKMYNIPEICEAREYYLESDCVEDKYLKKGEFGELILYHFLHEYFNADALISKIYFKDSLGVAAHGFDAVHVDSKNKILWLGESKLYSSGNSAIDALIKDENLRSEMGLAARKFVEENYNVEDNFNYVDMLYKNMVKK